MAAARPGEEASSPRTPHLATSSETKEVRFVDPADLDALSIHPSMRLRIDHYLEHRSAPYIG